MFSVLCYCGDGYWTQIFIWFSVEGEESWTRKVEIIIEALNGSCSSQVQMNLASEEEDTTKRRKLSGAVCTSRNTCQAGEIWMHNFEQEKFLGLKISSSVNSRWVFEREHAHFVPKSNLNGTLKGYLLVTFYASHGH